MNWVIIDPRCTVEHLGYIPGFLDEDDKRPAKEQFNDRYRHGGGWRPFDGFTWDPDTGTILFTDETGSDPPLRPLAFTVLREEIVFVFPHAWVMIFQLKDCTWEIARMD